MASTTVTTTTTTKTAAPTPIPTPLPPNPSKLAAKSQNQNVQLLHTNVINAGLPHGLGLLTTVASLPPKYRSRYLSITTKCETPLDLSVKPISPVIANDVPIATSFTEVYTEPDLNTTNTDNTNCTTTIEITRYVEEIVEDTVAEQQLITTSKTKTLDMAKSPITPPPTPTKRKLSEHSCTMMMNYDGDDGISNEPDLNVEQFIIDNYTNPVKMAKTKEHPSTKRDSTPVKPIKSIDIAPKTIKSQPQAGKPTKNKATRKLKFDEETSSPVSGTIIRPLEDITDGSVQYSNGDIDPKYNIVEITEETKAELAAIKNVIGDYICKLCRLKFDDAFGLAQHRCACIVLLEYRCPECGKQFNCPANLASHRRWHKPKKESNNGNSSIAAKKENRNTTNTLVRQVYTKEAQQHKRRNELSNKSIMFNCEECGKGFKRQAYLRKHQLTHDKKFHPECEMKTVNIKSARVAAIEATTSTTTSPAQIMMTTTNRQSGYRVGSSSSVLSGSSSLSSLSSSSSSASSSASSSSSQHSYSGTAMTYNSNNDGITNNNSNVNTTSIAPITTIHTTNAICDYDIDSMSDCSNSSTGYGRLQIVESGLTEEENIAAAALTNLRNCASVIQHTTLAH